MSGKVIEFMKQQKYRFDFGTDDKLYVITFDGKIPQGEIEKMLAAIQNGLYKKMSELIPLYLEQHHLEYSDLLPIEIPLEEDEALEWTGYLLHSENYAKLDETLGGTDVFYSVMDYQKNTSRGCEGCYHAVKRLSLGHGEYRHTSIGQEFYSDNHSCEEHGYFAIRKSKGNVIYTIDSFEGEPFIPILGCVNMIPCLTGDIDSKEDAVKAAVR